MNLFAVPLVAMCICAPTFASVTPYTNKNAWLTTVGSHTAISFTEYPQFTIITDQYAEEGIRFTDGNDFIFVTNSFPSDGRGLVSTEAHGLGSIHMSFNEPRTSLALDFIGILVVEFYSHDALMFASNIYIADSTPFVGFVSTSAFDSVIVHSPVITTVSIDNLYFGSPVPGPACVALLAIGAMAFGRRRRRAE